MCPPTITPSASTTIGWRLASASHFLFSVSTHAGELPDGVYDLQVSVVEDPLENGEIVFLDEVTIEGACELLACYKHGEFAGAFGSAVDT